MNDQPEKLLQLSEDEIEACRTEKGGFTKATLAQWGVPWPPPKGWRKALLAGDPIPASESVAARMSQPDAAVVALRKLMLACIESGNGHILTEVPELNAFPLPTVGEIIGSRRVYGIIGEVRLDDMVYQFTCARTVTASAP